MSLCPGGRGGPEQSTSPKGPREQQTSSWIRMHGERPCRRSQQGMGVSAYPPPCVPEGQPAGTSPDVCSLEQTHMGHSTQGGLGTACLEKLWSSVQWSQLLTEQSNAGVLQPLQLEPGSKWLLCICEGQCGDSAMLMKGAVDPCGSWTTTSPCWVPGWPLRRLPKLRYGDHHCGGDVSWCISKEKPVLSLLTGRGRLRQWTDAVYVAVGWPQFLGTLYGYRWQCLESQAPESFRKL